MRKLAAMFVLVFMVPLVHGAQTIQEKGKIETVTLFRGQALVTRVVPVKAQAGAVELTVSDLPDAVLGQSLFASSGTDLQIRAVRFRRRAVGKAPEKEVQELDDQIAAIEKQRRENEQMTRLVNEKQSYLKKLESFVAPTANYEMSKGVLNADTLVKVTGMMFEQRAALTKEILTLSESERELQKELNLLRRKRSELARSHTKTMREAIIFLDKTGNAGNELRLSYIVRNASWSPTYNLRGGAKAKNVTVEMGALAQQTSGEDWESVKLTLSTAGAQLVADGPSLAPLWLYLSKAPQTWGRGGLEKRIRSTKSRMRTSNAALQNTIGRAFQRGVQWDMNRAGQEIQQLELGLDPGDLASVRQAMRATESGLAVNYTIGGKVSLASRRDNQMVRITKLDLAATFFYEATPLLTEQVYRYAEMVNDSNVSLLEGNASVYLDGEFMGTANIPMVACGQKAGK